MTRRHLAVFLMVLGLVGGLVGAVATSGAATAGTIDWPAYLNGAQHSSYNPDAVAITPANAASLTPAWTFNPPGLGTLGNRFISSPTVYQGNIYIGSENGTFYDIDEATGGVVWSHFIGQQPKLTCAPLSFATTATVAPDPSTGAPTVYEAAPDGYLYAWDASTGNQLWRSVVGIPSTTQNDYFNWASATVANGMVYAGVSSNCDSPLVQGGLLAFDQSGGGLLARFQTNPTGDLGGSVWSSPMVSSDGSVYVTTGNQQVHGLLADSESVVRLDGHSLAQTDIFTVPATDRVGDGDFGASPASWPADLGGVSTPLVGACDKNGKFYALRASDLSAGSVWVDQLGYSEQQAGFHSLCIAAAVWDKTNGHLLLASNATTINGNPTRGSVRAVDPSTGSMLWQTPLPGSVLGTPALDGAGVLAVGTADYSGAPNADYLLDVVTGQVLATLSTGNAIEFAQPVFADGYVFVATMGKGLIAYHAPSQAPAPTVTGVSPTSGPAAGATSVTVSGTGFTGVKGVSFGSVPASSFSVTSGSQLTATSPPGSGSVDLTVTTSAGTSAVGPKDTFTYGTSVSLSLSPPSIPADGTSTSTATAKVIDAGGQPVAGDTVNIAAASNETVGAVVNHGDGTYSGIVTASMSVGQFLITATDTSAQPAASATAVLDQTAAVARPVVTGLSPSVGAATGGTTVTVTGKNFVGVTDVRFGTSEAQTWTVNSPTQITAVSPAAPAGTTTAVVQVVNMAGSSAPHRGDRFVYSYAKPVVTGLSPTFGPVSGGTTVTITGSNFSNATGARFGDTAATTFSVDSDTQITVTAPARPAGRVNVVVSAPGALSAKVPADYFTYQ